MIFNAHTEQIEYQLPGEEYGSEWKVIVDTANPSPGEDASLTFWPGHKVPVSGRSVVLLQNFRDL
jgi:isoamylase